MGPGRWLFQLAKNSQYRPYKAEKLKSGYYHSSKFTEYLKINRARLFASGSNVWTLAKWKMYDPEVGYEWGNGLADTCFKDVYIWT